MEKKKYFLTIFMLLLLLATCFIAIGCKHANEKEMVSDDSSGQSKKAIKVGISIPSADHGWTGGVVWYAEKAVRDWKKKDTNIEFFLATADSPETQVGDVEDLMVKGIDVLVILPHDSAPLTPICEDVKKKGIFLVVVDRGLTEPIADAYIAGNNPDFGSVSAEWMAKEMNYEGIPSNATILPS